jgi:hypothetical protein
LGMLSVVFAHQLVAVIMFVIILVTGIRFGLNRRMGDLRNLALSSIPALCLFLLIVYANYVVSSTFSVLRNFPEQASAGFMALFGFASYSNSVTNTLGFVVFCYLPLLPLVVLGARRLWHNLQLKTWITWIFIALLFAVVIPNAFIGTFPYRWTLLLSYPLAFFAAEAISGLRLSKSKIATVGLVFAIFSASFIILPNNLAFPYFTIFSLYAPTSMLQNTVSSIDCQNTVNALQWAKTNMSADARLLVHDVFQGWASLTFKSGQLLSYGYSDPAAYAQNLVNNGSKNPLYLIWWVNGSGWHGQSTVSSNFIEFYENGRIAIFKFNSSTVGVSSVS